MFVIDDKNPCWLIENVCRTTRGAVIDVWKVSTRNCVTKIPLVRMSMSYCESLDNGLFMDNNKPPLILAPRGLVSHSRKSVNDKKNSVGVQSTLAAAFLLLLMVMMMTMMVVIYI